MIVSARGRDCLQKEIVKTKKSIIGLQGYINGLEKAIEALEQLEKEREMELIMIMGYRFKIHSAYHIFNKEPKLVFPYIQEFQAV